MQENLTKAALRCSAVTVAINVFLTALKLLAGILAHSASMVSDAVHSASDVLCTLGAMVGIRMAGRPEDALHPYGHERFECVAAILLSGVLFATGLGIGTSGIRTILFKEVASIPVPGRLALAAAIVSITVKEGMYWYTRAVALRTNSTALMATAWDHRSDAFSSVGSFAGILGARLGYPQMDALASLVICLFILRAAYGIFKDSIDKMVDKALPREERQKIQETIEGVDGVEGVHDLRTRQFGAKEYVDVIILVERSSSLEYAHGVANNVHELVERRFPAVKHCMVHVHPAG